jgi:hypothetical protein
LKIADPATTTSTPTATASGGIGHVDPSVHLEAAPRFDSLDHLAPTPDLRERRVKEVRMSESAVHHHDQHLVEVLHDLLQNGRASRRLMATPTRFPNALMLCTVRDRLLLPSQWTKNESVPACSQ